jgi:prophage tail gpP-like protein
LVDSLDVVSLVLMDTGEEFTDWDNFQLSESLMQPCDRWSFEVGGVSIPELSKRLQPGAKVQVRINNLPQCTGYIDAFNAGSTRSRGNTVRVSGSNILHPVQTSTVNPKRKFLEGMTLGKALLGIFGDYDIDLIQGSNDLNLSVLTGRAPGSEGVRTDLEATTIKDLSPKECEGALDYCMRLAKRLGLLIWAKADGDGIVISQPDYTSSSYHLLRHLYETNAKNNVLEAELVLDFASQPSVVVAKGFTPSSDADSTTPLQTIKVNELCGMGKNGSNSEAVAKIVSQFPSYQVLPINEKLLPHRPRFAENLVCRPMFYEDRNSKTQAQLNSSVKRELARRQRDAFCLTYTVAGLTQNGFPYAVNTMVSVEDEVFGLSGPLFVLSRRFSQDRNTGSTTQLELILPHSIDL